MPISAALQALARKALDCVHNLKQPEPDPALRFVCGQWTVAEVSSGTPGACCQRLRCEAISPAESILSAEPSDVEN